MKTFARIAICALMLIGIFAAFHNPQLLLADGSSPTPMCAPGQANCDPGPMFPRPTGESLRADGSSPTPMCAPGQPNCDPGPMFPRPTGVLVADGSSPTPMCAPGQANCDPGPMFPRPTSPSAQ